MNRILTVLTLFVITAVIIINQTDNINAQDKPDTPFTVSTSYNNLLSNRNKTGLLDRVIIETFRRMGKSVEIVFTPTDKSLVDVNAGLIDAEMNRIEGMEKLYPNLIRVPEANMTMEFVAFSKTGYPVNGWESIRNRHIGFVKGWKILEENTRGFPNVIQTPGEYELFTMLDKGRIDIALYSKLTGYAVIKEMNLKNIHHLKPPLARREMFLYVNKKHADIVDDIAKALASVKADGTYDAILKEITSQ